MLVSKSKAAKLAGVSRTTIHRYATEGKLSMTGDQVDTSELIRVFGAISEQPRTAEHVQATGHDVTGGVQGALQGQIGFLEAQVRDIKEERDRWRERADQMTELLKAEQENFKLLTHQRTGQPEASKAVLVISGIMVLIVTGFFVWQVYMLTR